MLVIDARARTPEVTPLTPVAGVPLVARHVRLAARLGHNAVRVVCSDVDGVLQALELRPPPPGLAVEVVDESVPAGALPCLAVYVRGATGLEKLCDLATLADVSAAEARLFQLLRKSPEHDGWFAYHTQRPLARVLTRLLLNTQVTPNHVTLFAMGCGIGAALLAALGGYLAPALAGLLFWGGAVIDCVDGDLARLRIEGSRTGEWLDTLADDVTSLGIQLGLGVGLVRDGASPFWLGFAAAGAACLVLITSTIYTTLYRLGLPIDTVVFPWWFGTPNQKREIKGLFRRGWHAFTLLFRRDAWATFLVLMLVVGWRRAALSMVSGGTMIFMGLLVAHFVITAWRRSTAAPG